MGWPKNFSEFFGQNESSPGFIKYKEPSDGLPIAFSLGDIDGYNYNAVEQVELVHSTAGNLVSCNNGLFLKLFQGLPDAPPLVLSGDTAVLTADAFYGGSWTNEGDGVYSAAAGGYKKTHALLGFRALYWGTSKLTMLFPTMIDEMGTAALSEGSYAIGISNDPGKLYVHLDGGAAPDSGPVMRCSPWHPTRGVQEIGVFAEFESMADAATMRVVCGYGEVFMAHTPSNQSEFVFEPELECSIPPAPLMGFPGCTCYASGMQKVATYGASAFAIECTSPPVGAVNVFAVRL